MYLIIYLLNSSPAQAIGRRTILSHFVNMLVLNGLFKFYRYKYLKSKPTITPLTPNFKNSNIDEVQ